ncbi:hypothetical protein BP6252_02106 [Coleophoma cylindrospora]|uniref:C2H2-type domain-containing protein n=1 Tax=Coleophoma cylindrospora TaxID=1849047 RepID=A0A3D8SDU6_9HELO|nr:hypothetical protein BP6252_02106 [Coleophoma cylindrospora]
MDSGGSNGSNSRAVSVGRHSQDRSKVKVSEDTSDPKRFQCPRCPKSFSRIENLTRHQANHDEVGKFACAICRKRFTRSDLLNRHRKIHGNILPPQDQDHVASSRSASPAVRSHPRGVSDLVHPDNGTGFSHENGLVIGQNQQPPASSFTPIMNREEYQQPRTIYDSPTSNYQSSHTSGSPMQDPRQGQGLTSLVEAALAPNEAPKQFQQYDMPSAGNPIDPSLWDGFLMFGDASQTYMGSYDADISWTLNFQSEGSPNYFDSDLLPALDYGENPYQNAPPAYGLPNAESRPSTNAVDGEEEEASDWPDKISGSPSPTRHLPLPRRPLLPVSWQPVVEESRMNGFFLNTAAFQNRPLQYIDDPIRTSLLNTLNIPSRNEIPQPGINDTTLTFPPCEVLDYFLRLYLQYVHPRFPVIHVPTLNLYSVPPLLLASMMFLGSSHSKSDRGRFSRMFFDNAINSFQDQQRRDGRHMRNIDNILTLFLLCLGGAWSGNKQLYEFAEGGRGMLITACRRSRLLDCRPAPSVQNERTGTKWLAWVETEKRKRLGLSIYIFDCQYPALFNTQPYISKAETTSCAFPCANEYWEASTADVWRMLLGPAEAPPFTYYLHALNCILLHKYVKPAPALVQTCEFGNIVLLYALHTHIFEWRAAISMLNPTGLMGLGTKALPIGQGLRDRRKWLVDALDSWSECYQTANTTIAACLLHRLGYISLDVSLSDMHLVGGRSPSSNDGSFAEDNLNYWANSEIASSTMNHVQIMLEICYNTIERGLAPASSYEIANCLFTGGMICWAYAKLKVNVPRERYVNEVRRASKALKEMGCWRTCGMFGRILNGFEIPKKM